jgi:hypothetical protein
MIRIVRGELAETGLEAVLRPVSAEWTAVTPAMRRLEIAAGPELERQCRTLGELPVGSAVITGAGALRAQFMIHVIVRSMDEPVSIAGVRRGFETGLRRVSEWGIQRLALAPLGTGAGNLDADDVAALMVPALFALFHAGSPLREADLHVDSDYEQDVFERHVAMVFHSGPDEATFPT